MAKRTWLGAIAMALAGLALACTGAKNEQRPTPTAGTDGPAGTPMVIRDELNKPTQEQTTVLPEVSGRLTGIEQDTLRIQTEGKQEVRLKIDPTLTAIDVDGRQVSLNELQPGTEVRASYDEREGAKSAVTVHARTGATMGGEVRPQGTGTTSPGTSPGPSDTSAPTPPPAPDASGTGKSY